MRCKEWESSRDISADWEGDEGKRGRYRDWCRKQRMKRNEIEEEKGGGREERRGSVRE